MLRVEMQELDTALTRTRTRKAGARGRHAELAEVSTETTPISCPRPSCSRARTCRPCESSTRRPSRSATALARRGQGRRTIRSSERPMSKMAATKSALLAEVGNIQGAVERDLAVVTREERLASRALFEATRKRAVDLNMKEIEYHRLDRTREQNEKLYELLLERMKEADLARMMRVNNIRVVDTATEPKSPDPAARISSTLGSALLLGLLARRRARVAPRAARQLAQDARRARAEARRHVPRPPARDARTTGTCLRCEARQAARRRRATSRAVLPSSSCTSSR